MRFNEIISELRKKKKPAELKAGDTTPHDYNPGWQDLNWLKERAYEDGQRLSDRPQLFMPRPTPHAKTSRDRRLDNLANRYAYDDEGNLKPEYEKMEQPVKDELREDPPILKPGKAISPPGHNKPRADLWTSTAIKKEDGWTSDWVRWTAGNQPSWVSDIGYLYKIKPGALILELDSDQDAQRIYHTFVQLGVVPEPKEYNRYGQYNMHGGFPWDQITKHFDAVTHSGYYDSSSEFMYGWDVESTAWLNTSFLQFRGEVKISVPKRSEEN